MKKSKRIAAVLLSAVMTASIISAFPASAATLGNETSSVTYNWEDQIISGDYQYINLEDGTVEITGYFGHEQEVSIPSTINGKKVTVIGEKSFAWQGIHKITLPEGITTIKYYAFSHNCLKNVQLPSTLRYIGDDAFSLNDIESLSFYDNVEYIGFGAFGGSNWQNNLPDGMTIIGKCLYRFTDRNNTIKDVIIPDGIVSISPEAFSNKMIQSVHIPDSVSKIGFSAFSYCTNLENVEISNNGYNIKEIGQYAFHETKWFNKKSDGLVYIGNVLYDVKGSLPEIDEFEIPERTVSITPNAFSFSANFKIVIIPGSISEIAPYAFDGCALTKIVIREGVQKIDTSAFASSYNLEEITIPYSVKEIEDDAFQYQKNSTKIYGYENTVAEDFAIKNNLTFIPIGTSFELTDNKSNIKVSGIMPEIPELAVTNISNTIKNSIATYKIDLKKNGISVQPLNRVKILIPSNDSNCFIACIKANGSASIMNTEYFHGYYRFTANDVGTFAVIKKSTPGDVNKDGIVDVNDVTLLQMHIANKTDLNGLSLIEERDIVLFESIDMLKDNVLDILDVTELQLYIVSSK